MTKIASLELSEFRCIDRLRLELDRVNVVTGPNGCGKSTVAGALTYAVTGKTPWTGESANGLKDLIRAGADRADVTVYLAGGDASFTRSIPHALTLSGLGTADTKGQAEAALSTALGFPVDQARWGLGPRLFDLDAKAQAAALWQILDLHVGSDFVRAETAKRGEETSLPLLETAEEILRAKVSNNLKHAHDECYKARTQAKKDAKAAKDEAEAARQAYLKSPALADKSLTLEAVEEALASLHSARGAQEMHGAAVARARRAVEDARRRVQDLEAQAPDTAVAVPMDEQASWEERLRNALDTLAQKNAEIRTLERDQEERAKEEAELARLRRDLESVESPCCPECGATLPDSLTDLLLQQVAKLERKLQQKDDPAPGLLSARTVAKKATEFIVKHEPRVKAAQEAARLLGALAEARANLQGAEAALAEVEAQEPPPYDADALATWEGQKRTLTLQRQHADLLAKETRLTARVRVLEELVWWFSPKGLQAQILASRLEPLVANLNAILARWNISCLYDEETLALSVSIGGREPQPYDALSDGQKLLVALAHQVFFAASSGSRVVVLDRIEALDPEHQARLYEACLQLEDQVDLFFLLGVRAEVPTRPGLRHHDLTPARVAA